MKPTGGGATVTPIAPPAPLFPGITGGVGGSKKGSPGFQLGEDLFKGLHDISSGLDVGKIFQAVTDANKRFTDEGTANITEQFAASGNRFGSDLMRNLVDYRLQSQKDLQSQLGQMSFQGEALKMSGLQMIESLATSFAPTQVVSQNASGPSGFSQGVQGAEAVAMLMMAMAACWIAASFYGHNDWRTHHIRTWLHTTAPKWFERFYIRRGRWIADTPLRWLFRPLFAYVLRRY